MVETAFPLTCTLSTVRFVNEVSPPPDNVAVPSVIDELAVKVVNVPAAAVEPPITALSTVPPFISGEVKVLFVKVCAPSVVANTVPTCGSVNVLVADKLCAAP